MYDEEFFATGRYAILDSVFFFLKGLVQLRKKGVFACNIIKKKRSWPFMVPDKDMDYHFGEAEVGRHTPYR